MFAAILAVIKAIPALRDLVERFVEFYLLNQWAEMQSERREGLKKAIESHDQRDLERAVNNPHAGEPSGNHGTTVRDHLPGV